MCEANGVVWTEAVEACELVGHRPLLESHAFAVSVIVGLAYVREVPKK